MSRRLPTLVAVCSAALLLPFLWPLATHRVSTVGDLGDFHIPMRHLYQEVLRSGDSLLWTPRLFAGFYVHAEGQIGMLHPLHLLLYGVLPLGAAVNVEMIATYVCGFAGMYWLLRRLALAPAAALMGGMLFAFCGIQMLHFQHLNLAALVAHIPWLLAAADMVMLDGRPSRRGFAAVALVVASAALLGFPQGLWWNGLALSAFVLVRAIETGRWTRVLVCAIAALDGLAIGAIQILPTLDLAAHSMRTVGDASFFLSHSLHPWNALQLWSPYVFANVGYNPIDNPQPHEVGIYSGALLSIAPFWVWARRRAMPERRVLLVGLSIVGVLAFVLALGRYGGLYSVVQLLPGVGMLRAPARYIALVQLVLVVMAAIAIDDAVSEGRDRRDLSRGDVIGLLTVPLLSVATTLLLNTRLLPVARELPLASLAPAAGGTVIVIVVGVICIFAARRRAWALSLLVCLTAVDLGLWGLRPMLGQSPVAIESLANRFPDPPSDPGARYAIRGWFADRPLMKDYSFVYGYVGLYPRIEVDGGEDVFVRLGGARWRMDRTGEISELMNPVPRVRLVAEAVTASSAAAASAMAATVTVETTAVVERAVGALSGAPGTARVTLDRPGRIAVGVDAPGRQLLVLTERFDGGWHAMVNGQPREVLRVYGNFLGCLVEPGEREVELHFMPASFVRGAAITLAGLAALGLGLLLVTRVP
jgi:hypothetical protein